MKRVWEDKQIRGKIGGRKKDEEGSRDEKKKKSDKETRQAKAGEGKR